MSDKQFEFEIKKKQLQSILREMYRYEEAVYDRRLEAKRNGNLELEKFYAACLEQVRRINSEVLLRRLEELDYEYKQSPDD